MKKYISIGLVLALFFISNLSDVALAQQADVDPNTGGLGCISLQNNLRRGARDINTNGEVSTLQDFMQTKGLLSSDPTGYFGLLTFNAVKSLQTSYGLSATGYVGALTRLKIKNETCGTTTPPATTTTSGGATVIFPSGCTSVLGYSSTTGLPCTGGTNSPVNTNTNTNTNTGTTTTTPTTRIQPPYSPITVKSGVVPRIMIWYGKVNQHVDENGAWQTDPNGVDTFAGANVDKLTYCKYFYPNTTSIRTYQMETISTWKEKGNVNNHTSRNQSYECVQSTTTPTTSAPSIVLTAKFGSSSSQDTLTVNSGEKFYVSGTPLNLKGPNYGTDFTAAWFFDSVFNNACANTDTTYYSVWNATCAPAFTSSGTIYVEIYQNGFTYTSNKIKINVINGPVSTADKTKRISVWSGKVNQHVDANGAWQTDPNGFDVSAGATVDKLTYCKKFYPDTVKVSEYKMETIGTWRAQGNIGAYFTGTNMSYRCWQSGEVPPPTTVLGCELNSAPSLTILTPNGGESFTAGQQVTVNWTSCNIPANAVIEFGMQWPFAALNLPHFEVPNTGSAVYTLPSASFFSTGDLKSGLFYKIGISAPYVNINGISVHDGSDNWFTINSNSNCVYYSPTTGQPCIKVVYPTGGPVTWNPGTYQILWQAGSGVTNVKVSFCYTISANTNPHTTCTDGPFNPVTAPGVAGLGQIGVTVPNPHPGNEQTVTGKIRVSDANNASFYDESDNPVTIISSNFPG